jgi:hypothetical protein
MNRTSILTLRPSSHLLRFTGFNALKDSPFLLAFEVSSLRLVYPKYQQNTFISVRGGDNSAWLQQIKKATA